MTQRPFIWFAFELTTGAAAQPPAPLPPPNSYDSRFQGDADGYLTCLDPLTSLRVWRNLTSAAADPQLDVSPVVADSLVIAASRNGFVYAFRAASGRAVWQAEVPGRPLELRVSEDRVVVCTDCAT